MQPLSDRTTPDVGATAAGAGMDSGRRSSTKGQRDGQPGRRPAGGRWAGRRRVVPRRVVVTGLGAITSLGPNAPATWERLLAGETGIRRAANLDPGRHACLVRGDVDDATVAGPLPRAPSARRWPATPPGSPASPSRRPARPWPTPGWSTRTATSLPAADLDVGGAVIGTCVGGTHDDFLPPTRPSRSGPVSRIPPHLHVMFPHNLAAYTVQHRFGMRGPSLTVVTACATGAQAIGEAFHAIKYGQAPLMVAGAIESTQHPLFQAGFAAMRALVTDSNDNPGAASRPFDATRAGFVLGEGCGIAGPRGARARAGPRRADLRRDPRLRHLERRLPPDRPTAGRGWRGPGDPRRAGRWRSLAGPDRSRQRPRRLDPGW